MKKALLTLSTITAIVAAFVAYASKAQAGDSPAWLSSWAVANRPALSFWLFVLALIGASTEWIRAIFAGKLENRSQLQRFLNDFSKKEFDNPKRNRLTLFRVTSGWWAWFHGLRRLLPRWNTHKWKALRRVKLRGTYLVVYLRAAGSRSPKSSTCLRVSDQEHLCEGMAGRAWEEGYCVQGGLAKLSTDEVRSCTDLKALPPEHPVRQYAEATYVKDIVLLHSIDNFARHFMGALIRKSDGSPWGVLLLDSEDDKCPFPKGTTGGKFGERFDELATLLGNFVG